MNKKSNKTQNRQQLKQELNEFTKDFNEINKNKKQETKSIKHVFNKNILQSCGVELTPKQHELYKTIRNSVLTIIQGPAGTSKTFVMCYTALALLADGKIDKIVITKPLVEANERSMGYLKGSIDEKTLPFMLSYISTFEKILGKYVSDVLFQNKIIEIAPLNFMRGNSYDNAIILGDELQNFTMTDIILLVTRMSKSSLCCLAGDVSQYDIKKRDAKFLTFIDIMKDIKDISHFKFEKEDIMRHKLLIDITDRYEKWKYSNENN